MNLWVLGGVGFIFAMTCLGSAVVFFFRESIPPNAQRIFLGFAAGVMIAASIWSLLIPAIEETQASGGIGWIPASVGFLLGALFLLALDKIIPHLHAASGVMEGGTPTYNSKSPNSQSTRRTTLLITAVTLHNIPEGMAVGLSFALAAQRGGDSAMYASAIALALGIGIQNFPEGAAISLPLRQEGTSAKKSFLLGCLSGAVEPVFGLLTVLAAGVIAPFMPWLLSFAAGAMMYVVVDELIPEANPDEHSDTGTLGVLAGFLIMMVLDVALG